MTNGITIRDADEDLAIAWGLAGRDCVGRLRGNTLHDTLQLNTRIATSAGAMQVVHEVMPLGMLPGARDFHVPENWPVTHVRDLGRDAASSIKRAILNARQLLDQMRAAESGIQLATSMPKVKG